MTISQTLQSWLPPYATRQSCTPERDAAEYALLSPEARDEADNEAVIAVSPRASRTTYRITILLLSLMSVTVASLGESWRSLVFAEQGALTLKDCLPVVLPATFHTLQLDARSSQQCTTLAEAFKGSWLPHSPPILSASALGPNISDWSVSALSCDSKDNNTDVERVLRVANWDWTPQSCEMRPWDAEQVVRHLLRSPYGVIFAGDSIAGQHLNAFAARLNVQSSPALTVPSSHGIEGVGGSAGHILNPLHPLYTTLLEEGTFSDTRLKRPILVRLTSYHLGTNTQLKSALRAGYPGSQATRLTSRYSWGSDADVGETMRDVMEMYGGEDETATAPTYLVLNSGAHWSTYRFEGLDPVDNSTQLVSAYATVVRRPC